MSVSKISDYSPEIHSSFPKSYYSIAMTSNQLNLYQSIGVLQIIVNCDTFESPSSSSLVIVVSPGME